MSDIRERVARQACPCGGGIMHDPQQGQDCAWSLAHTDAVLAVIAEDVDGIAGVLLASMSTCCEDCRGQESNVDESRRQAEAVAAYLRGAP